MFMEKALPGSHVEEGPRMQSARDQPARLSSEASTGAGSSEGDEPTSVSEQLLIMKKEIDLLQIEIAKPAIPWYRQLPVLVSVAALLLSLTTTFYSERRSSEQDLHNARVELRQLIFQIDETTFSAVDIATRYKNNPSAQLNAASSAVSRRIILVNQAADVVDEIGDKVTATEYLAVGHALASLGTYDARVFDYYQRGLTRPADVTTKTALYRSLAEAYFGTDRPEEGRKTFEGALSASAEVPAVKVSNDAYTQFHWATAELGAGSCVNARQHFEAARQAYDSIANSGGTVPAAILEQLKVFGQTLEKRC
jgi:hypothetical protein